MTIREMHVVTGILMQYEPEAIVAMHHSEDQEFVTIFGPPPSAIRSADLDELDRLGWAWDGSLPAWRKAEWHDTTAEAA